MTQPGISMKVLSLLEATFFAASEKLAAGGKNISAINIQVDSLRGELRLFGESDFSDLKGRVTIYDWIIKKNEDKTHYQKRIGALLKQAFTTMRNRRIFNRPCIVRPFHIYLIDRDGNQLEQVFSLSEKDRVLTPPSHHTPHVILASPTGKTQPLLPNLERDLNIFLDKLLPELK
jgi:hypothetical protein